MKMPNLMTVPREKKKQKATNEDNKQQEATKEETKESENVKSDQPEEVTKEKESVENLKPRDGEATIKAEERESEENLKPDFMIPLSFQSDMSHIHQKAGFTHVGE